MKTKLLSIFVIVLVFCTVCTVFVGCNTDKNTATDTITVTDAIGREIKVPANASKIVCIGAGALRLYSYVGDVKKLLAVEEIEGSRTTARIAQRAYQIANEDLFAKLIADGKTAGAGGPQAQILNTERLAELAPDLIFSCLSLSEEQLIAGEQAIGCPIVTLRYGNEKAFSNELITSLKVIGKAVNRETRANKLCDYINTLKQELASYRSDESESVYLACNSNWGVKGFLSTAKNYPLFTVSGIKNVLDNGEFALTDGYADLEAVVNSGADKIILDAGGLETFKGEYTEANGTLAPALEAFDAFKNKEVYLIMPNNAYDANVETYFINAFYCVNVAYGKNIDIEKKANEITKEFLGKELYDEITIYGGYQKLDLPTVWPTK